MASQEEGLKPSPSDIPSPITSLATPGLKDGQENYQRIIYAGQSHRRRAFLDHAFGKHSVLSIEGGEEEDTSDVSLIMLAKISHVLNNTEGLHETTEPLTLIAADTRTKTLKVTNGHIHLESRGKPKSIEQARQIFVDMATVANEGITPFYLVESASGSHTIGARREQKLLALETCIVQLKPDYVTRFSTEEGFAQYLTAFNDFYSSPPYSTNNLPSITVMDLSGALSLPVLTSMGSVLAINGVHEDDPEFEKAFKKGLHTVAVGIAPQVIKSLHPSIETTMQEWEWANSVTKKVLHIN